MYEIGIIDEDDKRVPYRTVTSLYYAVKQAKFVQSLSRKLDYKNPVYISGEGYFHAFRNEDDIVGIVQQEELGLE